MRAFLASWIVGASVVFGAAPPLPVFPEGNTFAPYLDCNGYIGPVVDLGSVVLADGIWVPVTLSYSSAIRPPSPEFGQAWECPFLDAKLVDAQANVKKLETFGGKTLYIGYDPRTQTWKHLFSEHWTGQAKNDDDFEIAYDKSWKFIFHKGLISSMVAPKGQTFLWNRNGEKLVSISEVGKPPAFEIAYDKLGFAKQIKFNQLGNRAGAPQVAQVTYDLRADLVHAGICQIDGPHGREVKLSYSSDAASNPVLDYTDTRTKFDGQNIKLSWDKKTGKILSAGDYAYQIDEQNKDNIFPRMARTSRLTHKIEKFYFDQTHGTTDVVRADGVSFHTEMIQAPGPNYKAIRLVQETKGGKTRDILRRAFDGKGRLIMESIGLLNGKSQVKQFIYDDQGRILSCLFNGKEAWKNSYDPVTGQLKERVLPSLAMKMDFETMPGGRVKETIVRNTGAIASTQVLDTNNWKNLSDSFQKTY